MKLDNIIFVSGLPGLHKLLATRPNGILIEGFDNNKRQFVSARKHQLTPLVSIGIYTYTDVVGLDIVLSKIDASSSTPIPDPNDKADVLRNWFKTIVSDHDEDRVHINDIRKLIKWYTFLKQYAWDQVQDGGGKNEDDSAKSEDDKETDDQ